MDEKRFEAVGERGEACIIIVRDVMLPTGQTTLGYALATGERLKPAETPGKFVTVSGNRTFTLREPRALFSPSSASSVTPDAP